MVVRADFQRRSWRPVANRAPARYYFGRGEQELGTREQVRSCSGQATPRFLALLRVLLGSGDRPGLLRLLRSCGSALG